MQDNWDPDWQSTSSSKVAYLVQSLKALLEGNREVSHYTGEGKNAKCMDQLLSSSQMTDGKMSTDTQKISPEKVLIFSQFLEHIHVIEQQVVVVCHRLCTALCDCPHPIVDEFHFYGQLTFAGIKFAGMYSPMHSSNKVRLSFPSSCPDVVPCSCFNFYFD